MTKTPPDIPTLTAEEEWVHHAIVNGKLQRILIAGMPQAGSTLCFNLVRLLVENSDDHLLVHFQGDTYGDGVPSTSEDLWVKGNSNRIFQLMKQHFLPPNSICFKANDTTCSDLRVFVVKRDLRDTIASAIRKDPSLADDILGLCQRNIDWFTSSCKIRARVYEWVYETYKADPLSTVYHMRNHLRINTPLKVLHSIIDTAEDLKKKALSLNLDTDDMFWRITRLRAAHLTNSGIIGGYKATLTPQQIEAIETEYGWWLKKHGYMD